MAARRSTASGVLIQVAEFNPSFATFGIARATIDTSTMAIDVLSIKGVFTEKDCGKKVRRNNDDLARTQKLTKSVVNGIKGSSDLLRVSA